LQRIDQRLQLLGGRMEIASAPGEGSRITLYSPLRGRKEDG
jgi:signal transduction histidine kinase